MKRFAIGMGLVLVLTVVAGQPVWAQKSDVRGVTRTEFGGWKEALRMEARSDAPAAVIVPGVGGRVVFYGKGQDNILWLDPATAGRTHTSGEAPFRPGGYECDLGPEVAALPPHPLLTLGAYEWSGKRKSMITLKGPEDPAVGAEIEKEILLDPTSGELGFVHRLKNTGDRDAAFCFWHRIACRPGGWVVFPLNAKSRFAKGWSIQREEGGKRRYDAVNPESEAVTVDGGILVARTGGAPTKIGADSDAQWMGYVLGRTFFVIHFPYYSGAIYSEAGNSVAAAWDGTMTELQPIGPEARLRARRTTELPMKWMLIDLPKEPVSADEVRALAAQVPSSPFL